MKPGLRSSAKSTDATVRRQELGEELRQMRLRNNLALREVAHIICVDQSYVSRIENGFRLPSPCDLASLLTAYRADRATRDRLMTLAAEADESGWWQRNLREPTERQRTLVSLEAKAESIVHFEVTLMPGLLQTSDYTRALMTESGIVPQNEIEDGMAARFCRQSVLEQWKPPTLLAIIDEPILHRMVGGPKVMRRQLDYLVESSQSKRATVRIIPSRSSHAGMDGSFELISQPSRPPVVFVEEAASNLFIEHPDEVCVYQRITASLLDKAMDERESIQCIASYAERLDGVLR